MSVIKILKFGTLLNKAIAYRSSGPDWNAIYRVADFIRTQEISPKHALSALGRKLNLDNQRVVLVSLSILETLMNNCGTPVHNEVLSTPFVIELLHLNHSTDVIRAKVNGLINVWETAFSTNDYYTPLHSAYKEIKMSGYRFLPFTEREHAMIANLSSNGPNVFQNSTIKQNETNTNVDAVRLKELQLAEEEELNLALALSASEAEAKLKGPGENIVKTNETESTILSRAEPNAAQFTEEETDIDTELARYLNRNYWARRASATGDGESITSAYISQPSAPILFPPMNPNYTPSLPDVNWQTDQNLSLDNTNYVGQHLPGVPPVTDTKREEFLEALRKSIEIFSNRIRVNSQRNRSIQNDPTIQALFHTLHAMHPQLLQYSSGLEQRRVCLEQLQDKTLQIHDAREALDMLRAENAEKRRLEEAEASRKRQIQLMQKVETMRLEKQRIFEEQRRIALEQTLQFQQQYQYSMYPPNIVDPSMGYVSPMGVPATNYPGFVEQSPAPTNYTTMGYAYPAQPMQFKPQFNQSSGEAPLMNNIPHNIASGGIVSNNIPPSDSKFEYPPSNKEPIMEILDPISSSQEKRISEELEYLQPIQIDLEQFQVPASKELTIPDVVSQLEMEETSTNRAPSAESSISILEMPEAPTDEVLIFPNERGSPTNERVVCLE